MAVTFISRLFGLVRMQLIAWLLGATRLGDVWTLSFMIPNLFRRLIGEGAMSSAFVPILSELTEKEQEQATREFMRNIFSLILLASTLIVSLMILILPWILPELIGLMRAGATSADPEHYARIVLPTRIMFPYLIFISLAAICQGVLNVQNRFALSAATPILLNICIISFGFLMRDWMEYPLWGLCTGVLIGGFLQFFVQWVHLYRLGFRLTPVFRFWNKRTREAFQLWLPSTFSAGVTQINALVSSMVAFNLIAGGAMAVETSTRLMELILGVFAVALSTSLLPALSRQRARNDLAAMSDSLFNAMGVMALITIPAAMGLMLAGPSIINVLFKRGAFDMRSLELTYVALIFHAMALIPIAWYRIVVQIFYAHKQVKLAMKIAIAGATINILGCFLWPRIFPAEIRHCGVALATLCSSWSLLLISIIFASRRFQCLWPKRFTHDLLKILLAALAFIMLWSGDPLHLLSIPMLAIKIAGSIAIYGALTWLLKVEALRSLISRKKTP